MKAGPAGEYGPGAPVGSDGALSGAGPLTAFRAPPLVSGEAHVWFARGGDPGRFESLLDAEELARADRFVFPEHRARFVVAHGLLRSLLAAYRDGPPGALRFVEGRYGKPSLADGAGPRFSLSHSEDGIAVALARDADIGVDIERVRAMKDRDDLVARFFSEDEKEAYFALPPARREQAFFRLWTRKEAFVKGIGLGFSRPLESFTVNAEMPARIGAAEAAPWCLHHLSPGDGFVGALAVGAASVTIRGGRLSCG
ncbi:MAG: 4'-phosphopantetheinyl transferase superfamily protein [Proteobacteria bacterium]|nr:4'-phosphopantetheinyl transferase superfamily protein [Pseudomonadota bacterium]